MCECQIHFARMEDGEKREMPHFAGQRGPEIARSLLEIESVFEKNLTILKDVKNTILDVKATSWHDDYNKYEESCCLLFINVKLIHSPGVTAQLV